MVTKFVIHKTCRKDYTRASSIETFKRKCDATTSIPISDSVSCKLRSTIPSFDIKSECFYCAETILDYRNLPRERQNIPSEVATIEYLQRVLHRCDERADDWGTKVKLRIQNVNDLVAAEAKYHRKCSQLFALGRTQDIDPEKHTGRPVDQMKAGAFEQLCHHINSNDKFQYSFGELLDLYTTFVGNGEGYTSKRLKQKLKEHYGDNVTITTSSGRLIIYSFCDIEHDILRDNWKSARDPKSPTDKDSIISAAASIIRNDIRTTPYDCLEYPQMDVPSDCASLVPESLLLFLRAIIKSNMDTSNSDRRCVAIAHSIISACRPWSFISPLLLAIAVYVHRKYGSRELVDILNSLGFPDDYKEVQRLNRAFVVSGEPEYNLQNFTQFVFDNADFNVATLTGHDTFHAMGGIAAVTPSGDATPRALQRNPQLSAMEEMGQFSTMPLKIYRKPSLSAMKSVIIGPLEPPVEEPTNLKSAKLLDTVWVTNLVVGVSPVLCPFWGGFMQLSVCGEDCDKSRIEILPFINQDPQFTQLYTLR